MSQISPHLYPHAHPPTQWHERARERGVRINSVAKKILLFRSPKAKNDFITKSSATRRSSATSSSPHQSTRICLRNFGEIIIKNSISLNGCAVQLIFHPAQLIVFPHSKFIVATLIVGNGSEGGPTTDVGGNFNFQPSRHEGVLVEMELA